MYTGPPHAALREHVDDVTQVRFFQAGVSHVQNFLLTSVEHSHRNSWKWPFSDKKITCADHDPCPTHTITASLTFRWRAGS